VEARLSRVQPVPLVRRWYERRPFLTAWGLLALGMLVLVVWFGLDAGLNPREMAAVIGATVLLSLLCVWIVFLEESDPEPQGADSSNVEPAPHKGRRARKRRGLPRRS
jgi:hypothetical protein